MVTRSRSGGQKSFFLTPAKLVQLDSHIDTPTSSCTSPPGDNGPEPELESEPEPEPEPEPGPGPGPGPEPGPEPEPVPDPEPVLGPEHDCVTLHNMWNRSRYRKPMSEVCQHCGQDWRKPKI